MYLDLGHVKEPRMVEINPDFFMTACFIVSLLLSDVEPEKQINKELY